MLIIVDDQRIMHGRYGFEKGADRALIGCDLTRDAAYESRLRVLELI